MLAVAGSLLLEGDWLNQVPHLAHRFESLPLWESQKQALSQALYLLDTYGDCLLVADPTGSGKTRMGAGLHLLLLLRLYHQGRDDHTRTTIITPPQVKPTWQDEFRSLGGNEPIVISHGILSRPQENEAGTSQSALQGCRILFLDEAHNFLNKKSNRSASLLGHQADHTVLFTATPINRKTEDLFRILDLMDPDNLSDESLKTFDYWNLKRMPQSAGALDDIRKSLSRFTIRRTKGDLNAFIARNPDGYTRTKVVDGVETVVKCRYPASDSKTYTLHETENDIKAAQEIDGLAGRLKGLIYLRRLTATPEDLRTLENQQRFLAARLRGAQALAAWNVRATLRSSRVALFEHLEGTVCACARFELTHGKRRGSGNIIGTLLDKGFPLPIHRLTIPLPDWITDESLREKALHEEIEIYREIGRYAETISDSRERAKVNKLLDAVTHHERILAFDSRVISLEYLNAELYKKSPGIHTLVVTGGRLEEQRQARQMFHLDSSVRGWVGLCSDAMAEGVNLQGARCLVLLDMPSVMRLAEQRIGRIDRMNSPFESIELWWPDDHPSFALRTDQRFFRTAESVKALLGSNIEIPELLTDQAQMEVITGSTAIQIWEEASREASGSPSIASVTDAFFELKRLYSGDQALVDHQIYQAVRALRTKTVWATVASHSPWALIVSDEGVKAPRWTLWTPSDVVIDLREIVRFLRKVLPPPGSPGEPQLSEEHIKRVCDQIEARETRFLPHKKRRALTLLATLISSVWSPQDTIPKEFRTTLVAWAQTMTDNGDLFASTQSQQASRFNLDILAQRWIEIAEPTVRQLREGWRRRRFLSWGSPEVRKALEPMTLTVDQWQRLALAVQQRSPLVLRIKAVIWGITTDSKNSSLDTTH